MELLTYRLSDPNDKSKELAKKITELVVSSSVTIKEAMDAIRLSAELLDEMKVKMILPGFLIGVAATAATWIVVRLFPKQKYPKDNALVAAIGFGGAYFVSFAGWCLLYI